MGVRRGRQQANLAPRPVEIAHLLADGKEKQEEGQLFLVVIMELVDDDIVKPGQEFLEEIALIMSAVLEHESVIEYIGIYNEQKPVPLIFAGMKLTIVTNKTKKGFTLAQLLIGVVAPGDEFVSIVRDGRGRSGNDLVGKPMPGHKPLGILDVLAQQGIGRGDEQYVLAALDGLEQMQKGGARLAGAGVMAVDDQMRGFIPESDSRSVLMIQRPLLQFPGVLRGELFALAAQIQRDHAPCPAGSESTPKRIPTGKWVD